MRGRLALGGLWACLLWAPGAAEGARPDEPGALFAYDPADVLAFFEPEGAGLRVHYSVSGPNETWLEDGDGDGIPDYVALVADRGGAALAFYRDLGFRQPLSEADVGLPPLGGSPALDIYLVDFGLAADGYFAVDDCLGVVCAGHVVMENDFAGYGYPSLPYAVEILTAHELFHGVQYAYLAGQSSWIGEGTAVWAERAIGWGEGDFLRFADAYLEEAWRPLDRPPGGPVPAYAYGTALFFDHLSLRHGPEILPEIQGALPGASSEIEAVSWALEDAGDTLEDAWLAFAEANLSTGALAGAHPPYPYGAELMGVVVEAEGQTLDVALKLWGLGARYVRLDHPGGPLHAGLGPEGEGALLRLYGAGEGADLVPVAELWGGGVEPQSLGALEPGTYWGMLTRPAPASDARDVHLCLGGAWEALRCLGLGAEEEGSSSETPTDSEENLGEGGGCGGDGAAAWICWPMVWVSIRRRRRL